MDNLNIHREARSFILEHEDLTHILKLLIDRGIYNLQECAVVQWRAQDFCAHFPPVNLPITVCFTWSREYFTLKVDTGTGTV